MPKDEIGALGTKTQHPPAEAPKKEIKGQASVETDLAQYTYLVKSSLTIARLPLGPQNST